MALAARVVPLVAAEVPMSMAVAAQPFATTEGNGASMHFAHDPERFAVQRQPATASSVLGLYSQIALDKYFDELNTARFGPNKQSFEAPGKFIAQRLGSLAVCRMSVHQPFRERHPSAASVEPVRLSHRSELSLSVSLFDDAHRPIATRLLTGDDTAREARAKAAGVPRASALGDLAGADDPFDAQLNDLVAEAARNEAAVATPVAQHAGSGALVGAVALPPDCGEPIEAWHLDLAVDAFARNVAGKHGIVSDDSSRCFQLVAQNMRADAAISAAEPVMLAARPPIVRERWFSKPWEAETGEPLLRGQPGMGMYVEVWQRGVRCAAGNVYYGVM